MRSRYWRIVYEDGQIEEVDGEGIIGEFPILSLSVAAEKEEEKDEEKEEDCIISNGTSISISKSSCARSSNTISSASGSGDSNNSSNVNVSDIPVPPTAALASSREHSYSSYCQGTFNRQPVEMSGEFRFIPGTLGKCKCSTGTY